VATDATRANAIEDAAGLLVATVDTVAARAPAIVAAAARELGAVRLALQFGDGSSARLSAVHSRLLARRANGAASRDVDVGQASGAGTNAMGDRRAAGAREREPSIAEQGARADATVDVHFDDRSLKLLFDAERRPVDSVFAGSLDVRGERPAVLATWRCFGVLAQRASGLRAVQALWCEWRDRSPERWAAVVIDGRRRANGNANGNGNWNAGRNGQRYGNGKGNGTRRPLRDDLVQWPALDYLNQRYPPDVELRHSPTTGTFNRARSLWDGYTSHAWDGHAPVFDDDLQETMKRMKARVVDEILVLVPKRSPRAELYGLMQDYVVREGKGLRPTLTIASCMALGGGLEDAVRTAGALELFHNGFLVHDDIADESTHRRGKPTLHMAHGIGLAVNTGDAMNLFAIDLVLSNLPTRGLAGTLGLIHEVMHMCRETVEGQAIELGWIRRHFVPSRDADYFRMSTKKTGWYTCISPCRLGAVCAGVTDPEVLARFDETFRLIGIAFQIQDDVLNLVGKTELYGKEPLGDLLEGKRTVMMIHLFRTTDDATRRRMAAINAMPRAEKTQAHAEEMLVAMHLAGSIEYAIALADRLAHQGVRHFERDLDFIDNNPAKAVLRQIAHYVTTRPL
jgi:geranylgeranyl diphosphate synthase type II